MTCAVILFYSNVDLTNTCDVITMYATSSVTSAIAASSQHPTSQNTGQHMNLKKMSLICAVPGVKRYLTILIPLNSIERHINQSERSNVLSVGRVL